MKKHTISTHCGNVKMVPIMDVKPNPRNATVHPKSQIELLAKNIEEFGWRHSIIVSANSGLIVAGHARLEAARLLGCDCVPVEFQSFKNDAAEILFLLADNRIAELAERQEDEINNLLKEIAVVEGCDASLAGYDGKDGTGVFEKVFDSESRAQKVVKFPIVILKTEEEYDFFESLKTRFKTKTDEDTFSACLMQIRKGDSK